MYITERERAVHNVMQTVNSMTQLNLERPGTVGVGRYGEELNTLRTLLEAREATKLDQGRIFKYYHSLRKEIPFAWPNNLGKEYITRSYLMSLHRLGLRRLSKAHGLSSEDCAKMEFEDMVEWLLRKEAYHLIRAHYPSWGFHTNVTLDLVDYLHDLPEYRSSEDDEDDEDESFEIANMEKIRSVGVAIVARLDHIARAYGLTASVYLDDCPLPPYKNPEQFIEEWWNTSISDPGVLSA